jgi:multidrug efflux pump subunit AcrB
MSLPAFAIQKQPITYFFTFLLIAAGIGSFFQLGQLEDPEFTVKTGAIITTYPGASAEQVELEVTDRIETALQEMTEVRNIYSNSRPGLSIIKIDIKNEYWSDRLPQVWDHMRKKIGDMQHLLPPGAGTPQIGDDFGFVFGFLMAVTGDGFSYVELERYAKNIRKELRVVPGVARVEFWGTQDQRVYVETSESQLTQLGLTAEDLSRTLRVQNKIVDAGRVDLQSKRFRIAPTGEFTSPEEISELAVTGSTLADRAQGMRGDDIIRIKDFADVERGYIDPPVNIMRYNGQPAIAIALAPNAGVNAVQVGRAVDRRIDELAEVIPAGIELHQISWQSDLVADSIRDFMINLAQAVGIVLVVLALTMGVRMGIIIGLSGLVFAILGTFILMAVWDIDLQRVSLGALIIAMGMMVDNAIVVADGFVVRLQKGMDRTQAAVEAASQPAWPLLGATLVATMAFYPIFASDFDTGEYGRSLFIVVAIALILSWILSQTVTPLMCMRFIPDPKGSAEGADPYAGGFYQRFRGLLAGVIRARLLFLGGLVALLAVSIYGFGFVPQMFFPDSSRHQFMIDYWEPQGNRIQDVSANLRPLEDELSAQPGVTSVSAFIGGGPPRFYLPVNPEDPYPFYAQLIVNTGSLADVNSVMDHITPWIKENVPQALVRVRKYGVGSWDDWQFEARFSGPAQADPDVLRRISEQALAILEASPYAKDARTNWQNRHRRIVPEYNQERGRWAGVDREDLANATKRSFDGVPVGLYREGDDLIPIVFRDVQQQRQAAASEIDRVQILPTLSTESVPVSQVTEGIAIEWEDPLIWRWDRRRAITVQASPDGVTAPTLLNDVRAALEAIELPPGYSLEFDGEYGSVNDSQEALVPGIVPAVVIMLAIIVVLFNAYRPPLIIVLIIPFAIVGITFGLLVTGAPFGFMALLGAMSLSGMIIKNVVVLLDQVNINLADDMPPYDAVVEAAVSRLKPVVNATATTVLGIMPLLQDIFWVSMAVTIMFGLAFATILTMLAVPVFYATLYRITAPKSAG